MTSPPVVAELRLARVRHNLQLLRRQVKPGIPLCVAVKADAYGHGMPPLLPVLRSEGVEALAVASIPEALELRTLGWNRPILCLLPVTGNGGPEALEAASEAVAAEIRCTITSIEEARLLQQAASRQGQIVQVEVQFETGMGRLGFLAKPPGAAAAFVAELAALPNLRWTGVYTHFATADEPDPAFAREQLEAFEQICASLNAAGMQVPCRHAANSTATFRLPETHLDMVRPGLAVYGYWGGPAAERPDLQPTLRVVTRLLAVRRLPAGHAVGYGRAWRAHRDSVIGVLPIGYADGFLRRFAEGATVSLTATRGREQQAAPVVGRVSMDLVTVDLTEVSDPRVGDEVVLIDDHVGARDSVESIAARTGTIPYEITTGLGGRIERRAV